MAVFMLCWAQVQFNHCSSCPLILCIVLPLLWLRSSLLSQFCFWFSFLSKYLWNLLGILADIFGHYISVRTLRVWVSKTDLKCMTNEHSSPPIQTHASNGNTLNAEEWPRALSLKLDNLGFSEESKSSVFYLQGTVLSLNIKKANLIIIFNI